MAGYFYLVNVCTSTHLLLCLPIAIGTLHRSEFCSVMLNPFRVPTHLSFSFKGLWPVVIDISPRRGNLPIGIVHKWPMTTRPDSQLAIIDYSLLTIHNSLLTIHHSPFTIHALTPSSNYLLGWLPKLLLPGS